MKITPDSHTDHALTAAHVAFVLAAFGERDRFFLETVELPADLPGLPCDLHGPAMGDAPVPDAECRSEVRGTRAGPSRICDREPRTTRTLTAIGGVHNGECILFTAFGGPAAPREPWDPSLTGSAFAESVDFWAAHALSVSR